MPRVRFALGNLSVCSLTFLSPAVLAAQVRTVLGDPNPVAPVEALKRFFEGGGRAPILAAFKEDRVVGDRLHVGHYDRYTDAQRQELLDGLEAIAIGEVAAARVDAAREAVSAIAAIALAPYIDAPEERQIPRILLRIYEASEGTEITRATVHELAYVLALSPPEAPEIIQVLVEVATGSGPPGVAPSTGVMALVRACEAGEATLLRLHSEGRIGGLTAVYIGDLIERGFPREWVVGERLGRPCPEASAG